MKRIYLYENYYVKVESSPLSFKERLKIIAKEAPPYRFGFWYTPDEIAQMLVEQNLLIKNIIEQGELIYDEEV